MTLVCFHSSWSWTGMNFTFDWIWCNRIISALVWSTHHAPLEVGCNSDFSCILIWLFFIIEDISTSMDSRLRLARTWTTRTNWLSLLSLLHVIDASLCYALSRSSVNFSIEFALAGSLAQFFQIIFSQTLTSMCGLHFYNFSYAFWAELNLVSCVEKEISNHQPQLHISFLISNDIHHFISYHL